MGIAFLLVKHLFVIMDKRGLPSANNCVVDSLYEGIDSNGHRIHYKCVEINFSSGKFFHQWKPFRDFCTGKHKWTECNNIDCKNIRKCKPWCTGCPDRSEYFVSSVSEPSPLSDMESGVDILQEDVSSQAIISGTVQMGLESDVVDTNAIRDLAYKYHLLDNGRSELSNWILAESKLTQ